MKYKVEKTTEQLNLKKNFFAFLAKVVCKNEFSIQQEFNEESFALMNCYGSHKNDIYVQTFITDFCTKPFQI